VPGHRADEESRVKAAGILTWVAPLGFRGAAFYRRERLSGNEATRTLEEWRLSHTLVFEEGSDVPLERTGARSRFAIPEAELPRGFNDFSLDGESEFFGCRRS
jgi:hypothetical protein